MSGLARLVAGLAASILPAGLRGWGRAMVAETDAIQSGGAALRFAFGCLRAALATRFSTAAQEPTMPLSLTDRPRRLAVYCAAGAVGLGLTYLGLARAPASYFMMNAAAFVLGLVTLGALAEARRLTRFPGGSVSLPLAGLLLAASLWGVSAEGVTRWASVAGVLIQPSLVLVPLLVLGFLRRRDGLSALALGIAAAALALQPDRAMAAALAAGLAVLALARPGRLELAALAAAGLGFATTLIRDDPSPAMPFVDQILFTAFAAHPLAGLAVWSGAALMLLPAIVGLARDPGNRAAHGAFGAIWLAVIAAAALGNYPTPLVGYGGSAILGYLVGIIGLPRRTAPAGVPRAETQTETEEQGTLRAGLA